MLGKMSSLFEMVALLRDHSVSFILQSHLAIRSYLFLHFRSTITLLQNSYKVKLDDGPSRGLLETFGCLTLVHSCSLVSIFANRCRQNVSPIQNVALRAIQPLHNTFHQRFSRAGSAHSLHVSLMAIFRSIDGASYREVSEDPDFLTPPLLVCAKQNTWSRSARRKKVSIPVQTSNVGSLETQPPALRCVFECKMEGTEQRMLVLEVNWVQGRDRPLFESFWSHVCRKLEGRLQDSELGKAVVIEDNERL